MFFRTFAAANANLRLQSIFGEVLEWLKRHAWKACNRQNRFAGSNPVLSAKQEGKSSNKSNLILYYKVYLIQKSLEVLEKSINFAAKYSVYASLRGGAHKDKTTLNVILTNKTKTFMKKIFTLISMAFVAMSMNAQDVYNAIVDGKLASEFAAVAGENGGVANNAVD